MVCSLLGDLADQCNSLIDQYGPLVFDLLLPELDPTSICGTIGFCQGVDTTQMIAALTRVVIKVKMLPTADMCTDCKMFFGDVQKVLMDPNNQQTIISAVEQVCSLLGDLSSECQSLVEQYGSTVINAVAQVLDPQNTCNTIGFCGMLPKLRVKAGDPCTDCKAFFGDVKMMLSNATTQKEILKELKMVCSLLGDLADQCNSLIDQYGPLVFDLLLPELDPTSICGTIGFCQGVDTTQIIAALTRVVIKVKMLPTADMCTDCKMFFGDVQKVLMDPNNQQTILSAVEQVCSLLGDLSSECQSLVEQYGSTVINAVAQVLDPQNTCNTIGFCGMLPKLRVKAGDPCTDCKAFMGDVKMMLSNATTQKEILNELKMVCSLLGDLADQCNSLIDQYGPLVFDLLLPELDPTSICGTIGFCQGVDTTQMIAALTRVVIKVKW
ncbi:prosaposin-like [Amphiura filiformis]|uniref:prosaposin-like n=1 Tax=Amphiura filiformis TaxID=82378 RepID=UPI003B212EB4